MIAAEKGRIATLDIVRGVGVMGILAMNIVAFAMPVAAYINPLAYGSESPIDLASYAVNFVLVDGRMRGLFSFLFGASMLLVIERARARDENIASVHFRRMIVLLLFGAIHFYFIWFGDILFGYALAGMVAFFYRHLSPARLIGWGTGFVLVQFVLMASLAGNVSELSEAISRPGASVEALTQWRSATAWVRVPTPGELSQQMALYQGPWSGIASNQLTHHLLDPLFYGILFGFETLGYMLFGMAALRTGFLTGSMADRTYRRIARAGFLSTIPIYLLLAWLIFREGFSPVILVACSMAATILVRPAMIIAIAALVILLARDGGWLTSRVAAAGRAAFTNYLGTSILMTGLFYGWGIGLYGELSRAELWLPVLGTWLVMLAWSKPWLDHFHYGPLEWLWRSLSRGKFQPMRRSRPAEAA